MPARSPELRRRIARAGGARKAGHLDADELQGDLLLARIDAYVERIVAVAPPLTPRQQAKIKAILDAAAVDDAPADEAVSA